MPLVFRDFCWRKLSSYRIVNENVFSRDPDPCPSTFAFRETIDLWPVRGANCKLSKTSVTADTGKGNSSNNGLARNLRQPYDFFLLVSYHTIRVWYHLLDHTIPYLSLVGEFGNNKAWPSRTRKIYLKVPLNKTRKRVIVRPTDSRHRKECKTKTKKFIGRRGRGRRRRLFRHCLAASTGLSVLLYDSQRYTSSNDTTPLPHHTIPKRNASFDSNV